MRPLELRLRNFRSYFGDGHTFDFRGRHLLGVVGPIGSGKSTLLDAIAFALYGRTPRVNRSTRSLIHQRADHAAVALRFEVDGQIWEAVRQLRSKGQSQHALYLFEDDVPDPETATEKIVMEGEVNERIEALLGFDYDAFGRSVMLAQGKFAEFLTARPAERDKVLKGVFGHERIDAMRDLAKSKASGVGHEIEKLAIRLEGVEAAMGRLAGRRQALETLKSRLTTLESIQDIHGRLVDQADEARKRMSDAATRLTALTELAQKLPDATKSEEVISAAERAGARRGELAVDLKEAHQRAGDAEAEIKSKEFGERSNRLKMASELTVRLESRRAASVTAQAQLTESTARLEASESKLADSNDEVESTILQLSGATEAAERVGEGLAVAEQTLSAARHADMSATLRAELKPGDDCPVCAQPVHELSGGEPASNVSRAEAGLADAKARRDRAEMDLRQATAGVEAARAAQESLTARRQDSGVAVDKARAGAEEASAVVDQTEADVAGLLGEGDPVVLLETERVALDALGETAESARKSVEEIRRQHDDAIDIEQDAQRALGDIRTQVGALAAQLDAASRPPEDDASALRAALDRLRDDWSQAIDALQSSIDSDRAAEVLAVGQLAELCETHEIEESLVDTLAEVRAGAALAATEIAADEESVDAAKDLLDRRTALESEAVGYGRLATDLTDSRFIRYLLDEERAALAELGSEHFQRLTSGRYRFSDDGAFAVVDLTAADSVRKADSLSGGETFLASLGLALGLSEMVGRTGGSLDAFFLDEGFGSLDAEHLDLAMEGIEALVTDHAQRLVVVVSHVPELRHRIEDLIVLDRDPVTGDSMVVSGAVR